MRSNGYSSRSVCLSACVCVSVSRHLTVEASAGIQNAVIYSTGNKGQKICGDLPETTASKSHTGKQERRSQYANFSDIPAVSFRAANHC